MIPVDIVRLVPGSGTIQRQRETIVSEPAVIGIDHGDGLQRYMPAVVTDLRIKNDGDEDVTTDLCGRTERSRQSNHNWEITIEGFITNKNFQRDVDDQFVNNLTLNELKNLPTANLVRIEGEMWSGDVGLGRINIMQTSDVNTIELPGREEQKAYSFQLQLKEPEP